MCCVVRTEEEHGIDAVLLQRSKVLNTSLKFGHYIKPLLKWKVLPRDVHFTSDGVAVVAKHGCITARQLKIFYT